MPWAGMNNAVGVSIPEITKISKVQRDHLKAGLQTQVPACKKVFLKQAL
jgi:hypothetical protein